MKYLLITILGVLSFQSCNNSNNSHGSVTLEILNKELFFNKKYINNKWENTEYYNNIDRENARNIVTWKITNNTDKNYLFIINEDGLYRDETRDLVLEHIKIINKDNKERGGGMAAISWTNSAGRLSECSKYNYSIRKTQDSLRGWKHFRYNYNFRKNSIILHPGESHTYKSIISLPIIEEANVLTLQSNVSVFGLEDGDKLSIFYEWNAKEIENNLEQYQLEELKHNNTIIYNGTLESNKVPLKGR